MLRVPVDHAVEGVARRAVLAGAEAADGIDEVERLLIIVGARGA